MNCPACSNPLETRIYDGVELDVCAAGCGGVWFDQFEFRKFDEPHEAAATELLSLEGAETSPSVEDDRFTCPRCGDDVVLGRRFFSTKRRVEVDECPACAGVWLDVGELRDLRRLFPSETARKEAASAYFDEVFGAQLAAMRAESEESRDRAARFAHALRFVTPSYWIPGDQEWGAY